MGLHDGHRQRCKQRFLRTGAEGFDDQKVYFFIFCCWWCCCFTPFPGATPTRRPTGF